MEESNLEKKFSFLGKICITDGGDLNRFHRWIRNFVQPYRGRSILFERMLSSVMQEDYDVWRWLRAEDPEKRKEILIFNLCGIMGLVLMWYYSGFQRSPEEMAQMMENLMHKPLAKMQL